jgi:DnaJ-class molecular chaperone
MTKGGAAEIKCDACGGTGHQPAQTAEPGRRVYPGRCKTCGGKGRLPKSVD